MLDLQALERALNNIEVAAETGWLEESTHRIKDVEEKKGPHASFGDFTGLGVPPLAYIWYRAREILALGQVLGSFRPGYWGLTAAWLGKNIGEVTEAEGFGSIMARLKGVAEFRAAFCELYIAAGYLSLGTGVSFAVTGGGGFTITPGVRVFCHAGGSRAVAADRAEGLLQNMAGGLLDGGVALIYLEVMLGPGEEPEKVLGLMAEEMSGLIKAGHSKFILVSTIMEGTPGNERLRIWSESVMLGSNLPSEDGIYLPRLTFPA